MSPGPDAYQLSPLAGSWPLPKKRPTAWWHLRRRVEDHYAHIDRLVTLVDLYRQLVASEQRVHGLEDQLRRCRDWNTALLKDKHALIERVGHLEERIVHLDSRIDQAARAMLDAEARVTQAEDRLMQSAEARVIQGDELQRALKRCDDLAAKLKNRRSR